MVDPFAISSLIFAPALGAYFYVERIDLASKSFESLATGKILRFLRNPIKLYAIGMVFFLTSDRMVC